MACFAGCFSPDVAGSADQQSKQLFYSSGQSGGAGAAPASVTFGGSSLLGVPACHQSQKRCKGGLDLFSGKSGTKKHAPPSRSASSSSTTSLAGSCREELREACLAYGSNIMAVSTLQQDRLEHFVVPGIGYIAYAMMFNGPEFLRNQTAVALSDPVCAPQHFAAMAEAFLRQHPKAMWCQASAGFASVLQDLGFTVNSMGRETRLDLATYGFTGYARRGLRSGISAATKEGIVVQEVMHPPAGSLGSGAAGGRSQPGSCATSAGAAPDEDWSVLAVEMRDVGLHWAASKTGRASSFWFINRPPILAPEPGVRKFTARDAHNRLLGYVFFDGVFEGGQLVGYYANVTRLVPDAHPGTLNLIVKAFLETIRAEAQLAAPAKKISVKRSLLRKQQAAAAAAAAAAAESDDTAAGAAADQQRPGPAYPGGAAASAGPHGSGPAAAAARPRFLSLGLSPFFQMDNSGFNSCDLTTKAFESIFKHGEAFYPFKSLAAAKAKYGAGVHNSSRAEDPGVQYSQAYFCHRRPGKAALVAAFDLAKLCGLWDHPAGAAVQYVTHQVNTRLSKHRRSAKGPLSSSRASTEASCSSFSGSGSGNSRAWDSKLRTQQKQAATGAGAAAAVGCGKGVMSAAHGSAVSLISTAPCPPASEGGNELSSASVSTSVSTAVSAAGSQSAAMTAGSSASSTVDGA